MEIAMDVRVPIGGLLSVLGILVAGYGVATMGNAEIYAKSLTFNVNLWWGAFMLIFGLALLGLARRR
jgi:hypothetical protein